LVELARNRAVGDVVLVSGDEDVRIGVQLAQSFGVRVHLIGIKPCGGNQSVELRQEADTCTELDLTILKKIISMRPVVAATLAVNKKPAVAAPKPTVSPAPATVPITPNAIVNPSGTVPTASLEDVVDAALSEMTPTEIKGTVAYMAANSNNVPNELDGKVLARCKAKLGQYLDDETRKKVRKYLRQRVKDAARSPDDAIPCG
jgi:hypothetical protein